MMKIIYVYALVITLVSCGNKATHETTPIDSTNVPVDTIAIEPTTVTDIDGNVYKTITIGNQVWMAENLKTTKYNDGTDILHIVDSTWTSNVSGAYCWYDNKIANKKSYGALYNWYAVNTGLLAPKGWHVPTQDEWEELIKYIGEKNGDKLREKGKLHWEFATDKATNESGFTALPGGYLDYGFENIGKEGYWWSSTETEENRACGMSINGYGLSPISPPWNYGISVRCIKDSPSSSQNKGKAKEDNITRNNLSVTISFYAEKEDNKFVSSSSNILYKQKLHQCTFFLKKQFIPNGKSWTYKGCEVTAFNKKSNSSYTITEVPTSVFLSGNTVSTFFGSNGQVYTYPDRKLLGTGRLVLEGGDAFQFVLDLFGTVRYEGKIYFIEK